MKKSVSIFLFLVVSLFLVNFLSAQVTSCAIREECLTGETTIMQLSDTSNAHGGTTGAYPNVLCCDGSGSTTCSGTNKILGLSATTNAHAEVASQTNYATDVCYGDVEYYSQSGSCNTGDVEVLSLSSTTNAHIGSFSTYGTKICGTAQASEPICGNSVIETGETCDDGNTANSDGCSSTCQTESGWTCTGEPSSCTEDVVCGNGDVQSGEQCDDENLVDGDGCSSSCTVESGWFCLQDQPSSCYEFGEAYWAYENEAQISTTSDSDGSRYVIDTIPHTVKIIVEQTGCPNCGSLLEIWEDDPVSDDPIRTSSGGNLLVMSSDSEGRAVGIWEITQEDIDNAGSGALDDDDEDYEFYFRYTLGGTFYNSGILYSELGEIVDCDANQVEFCRDYNDFGSGSCNADPCGAAVASVNENNPEITCGNGFSCYCEWDTSSDVCEAAWDSSCGNGVAEPGLGEECDDGNSFSGDGCSISCEWETATSCNLNGNVDTGEFCDDPDLNGKTCADFGFEGSGLICDNSCSFDQGSCTVDPDAGLSSSIGTCIYTEDLSGDTNGCDDGFLSYSWDAAWTWDGGCDAACQTANIAKRNQCQSGESTVQCPAEIQLPFFETQGIIATIVLVALVYLLLTKRRHKK